MLSDSYRFGLPFGFRVACAKSDPATVFSSFVDRLFASSFPALDAGFLPVAIEPPSVAD
jgi:hypothetical protein